jgi:BirA family biotin operon repressor/biotin-[acetyl-CoA-carboxylase] ligase
MSRAGFTDVRRFAELDSTNRYLLDEARNGAPEGVVAVADFQRAGRGRLDRRWEAVPGGALLLSVLLRPALEPAQLHLATVVVALAAIDAAAVVAKVTPGLKWPNDLVVGEAKLAGILAEVQPAAPGTPGPAAVVAGIGMNVSWPGPPDVAAVSLEQAAGRPVDRDALTDALLDALAARRGDLDDPAGRQRLINEVRARCVTLGRTVRVDLGLGSVVGRAVDVSADGHLVVEGTDGPILVAAGDVVHLRPGAPPDDRG